MAVTCGLVRWVLGFVVPVNFLTEEQRGRWARFNRIPDQAQLGGFFHLDGVDRRRAMAANGARNQIGYAVQLGTARFLGCFLTGPEDVPAVVVDYRCDTNPGSSYRSYSRAVRSGTPTSSRPWRSAPACA
ncbi:DUF4158 domain-containing protein [Nonomuraea sp. NPDC049129]|uniref:DUF4158 domain-containing protein n=1 Tax=Nonomuraea sp. NPDC049129 TaxID=3155272 RepID=UPI0033F21586